MTASEWKQRFSKLLADDNLCNKKGKVIYAPLYMSENEFCKALKIDKKESERMRNEGEISYTQIKNKVYFRTSEVIELIFKNKK